MNTYLYLIAKQKNLSLIFNKSYCRLVVKIWGQIGKTERSEKPFLIWGENCNFPSYFEFPHCNHWMDSAVEVAQQERLSNLVDKICYATTDTAARNSDSKPHNKASPFISAILNSTWKF